MSFVHPSPTPDDLVSPHVQAWNEVVGPKFIRHRAVITRNASGHHGLALAHARPGQRVLDVGCGFGDTCALLAERVQPDGLVVGVDCTEAFLEIARREVPQVFFANVDAGTGDLGGPYDLVFSRFGTMFFTFVVPALENLRSALAPGGTLAMVTWRGLEENDWLAGPRALAHELLPLHRPPEISCGPGPFSMADPELVRRLLETAGFVDVAFEQTDVEGYMGRDVDEAVSGLMAIGPAGERVREASAEGPVDLDAVRAAFAELLRPYARQDGVYMRSASWTITARNP